MFRQLRSTHQQRRITLHQPSLRRPLEPATNSRQRSRHTSLGQPLIQQRPHISPYMRMLHRRHSRPIPQRLRQELRKPPHLPRVSPQRMLRRPPLIPHHRQESLRQPEKVLLSHLSHADPPATSPQPTSPTPKPQNRKPSSQQTQAASWKSADQSSWPSRSECQAKQAPESHARAPHSPKTQSPHPPAP